jgi:hypothetical protein
VWEAWGGWRAKTRIMSYPNHHFTKSSPFKKKSAVYLKYIRLGSVAGPLIQATGRSEFEDRLGLGDYVSGYSYHMSVRTGLPDHIMQTKFQNQWPSDVEAPVPSI